MLHFPRGQGGGCVGCATVKELSSFHVLKGSPISRSQFSVPSFQKHVASLRPTKTILGPRTCILTGDLGASTLGTIKNIASIEQRGPNFFVHLLDPDLVGGGHSCHIHTSVGLWIIQTNISAWSMFDISHNGGLRPASCLSYTAGTAMHRAHTLELHVLWGQPA